MTSNRTISPETPRRRRGKAVAAVPPVAGPKPPRKTPTPWARPGTIADTDPHVHDSVAVYRLFNMPGALLYVGISDDPKERFGSHASHKAWWHTVTAWTVEWFPDRPAALAAEAHAIVEEVPAYNITGVPKSDENPAPRWVQTFRRRQPHKVDLDELFLALLRLRSIQRDPQARRAWTENELFGIYVYARGHAKKADLLAHQMFIDQWNTQQEAAYYQHLGQPIPEKVPAWPHGDSWRERIGLWMLSRNPDRPRRRVQSDAELANREKARQTKVTCLATGILASVCDCHTQHVADEEDEARFGRPLGFPLGAGLSRKHRTIAREAA